MSSTVYSTELRERILIRLDTLMRLRWFAIIGQLGAVVVIAFVFAYPMPWAICLVLIAASAVLNLWLARYYRRTHRIQGDAVFALLSVDVLQLGALLYLTGGLQNPFAILLMAPVIVSSTSLKRDHTIMLGALSFTLVTLLVFFHMPLPWRPGEPLAMPLMFIAGTWVAIVCTLGFTAIYAFRVAQEARKLADALSATELVLQREQHLSALDGMAAAAAHELGTPLSTIALVSKEMVRDLPADSEFRDDAVLLRAQAERCRSILAKLTSLSSQGEPIIETQGLTAMVEEVVAPLRDFGKTVLVERDGEMADMPRLNRAPGIHYGLGNILDNAVDFASETVMVRLVWDDETVRIVIDDDGPGFPPGILHKLGEPFVSHRTRQNGGLDRGMGLGMFIAKTLLERSGADVTFGNDDRRGGAWVAIVWPRERLESERSVEPWRSPPLQQVGRDTPYGPPRKTQPAFRAPAS